MKNSTHLQAISSVLSYWLVTLYLGCKNRFSISLQLSSWTYRFGRQPSNKTDYPLFTRFKLFPNLKFSLAKTVLKYALVVSPLYLSAQNEYHENYYNYMYPIAMWGQTDFYRSFEGTDFQVLYSLQKAIQQYQLGEPNLALQHLKEADEFYSNKTQPISAQQLANIRNSGLQQRRTLNSNVALKQQLYTAHIMSLSRAVAGYRQNPANTTFRSALFSYYYFSKFEIPRIKADIYHETGEYRRALLSLFDISSVALSKKSSFQ